MQIVMLVDVVAYSHMPMLNYRNKLMALSLKHMACYLSVLVNLFFFLIKNSTVEYHLSHCFICTAIHCVFIPFYMMAKSLENCKGMVKIHMRTMYA